MSPNRLAAELHVPENRVARILSGRDITADTALLLGRFFGTGPEPWLNLQEAHELRLPEQAAGQENRDTVVPRRGVVAVRAACAFRSGCATSR
jgi:antitoxin HigA-1